MGVAVCLLAGALFAQQSPVAQEYSFKGHGSLRLTIPDGWRVSSKSLKRPIALVLHLRPTSGDAFDVQLTSTWLDPAALAKTTPESMRANVQRSADGLLPQAVEKEVTIQELRGAQTVGYYYALADRNPAPGEYKYLTQGSFLTGQLLTAFTILSRAPGAPQVDQALRNFESATYSER